MGIVGIIETVFIPEKQAIAYIGLNGEVYLKFGKKLQTKSQYRKNAMRLNKDYYAGIDAIFDSVYKYYIKKYTGDGNPPCPNCKETIEPCACMRNICTECGKPVGNITFTVCDNCWNANFKEITNKIKK